MTTIPDEAELERELRSAHRDLLPELREIASGLASGTFELFEDDYEGPFVARQGNQWTRAVTERFNAAHRRIRSAHAALAPLRRAQNTRTPSSSRPTSILAPTLSRRLSEMMTTGDLRAPSSGVLGWAADVAMLALYVDAIWIPDPAMLLRGPQRMVTIAIHEPFLVDPHVVVQALQALEALDPLLSVGAIRMYPALELYNDRVATRLWGRSRGYSADEMQNAWPDTYVREGLLFAEELQARYAPLEAQEAEAVHLGLRDVQLAVRQSGATDAKILSTLVRGRLPSFANVSPALLAEIRRDEEGFHSFRMELRRVITKLSVAVGDPDFDRDVTEVDHNELQPELQRIAETVRGTKRLAEYIRDGAMEFTAEAFASAAITGSVLSGAACAALSEVAKVILRHTFEHQEEHHAAGHVVLSLLNGGHPRSSLDS